MLAISDASIESLKLLVLIKAGLLPLAPSDICVLAGEIQTYTDKRLSATTLLRLYGFIPAKFPPSVVTKEALAQFCGYSSYAAYCSEVVVEANRIGK